jgi:CheY-like chemotaxis protein
VQSRGTLLLVDDEAMFASSLRRLFSAEHEVTIITRAREALDAIVAGTRFDAIVCDLMMPEVSGVELHRRIAQIAPDQAARMIFLTGGAYNSQTQAFLDSIPNTWFEKPCNLDELREAVRRAVENGRRPRM